MTAVAITPAVVDRLAKLAGMLASSFDGERATAANLLTRDLRAIGITPRILVERAFARPEPSRSYEPPPPPPTGWRATLADCQRRLDLLTPWERDFIGGLGRFPRLSAKQQGVLDRIAQKVMAAHG